MAVVNTIRPSSVLKAGAGTSVPSGTLAAVTSDNSGATYILFNLADYGDNWSLRCEPHTPAAGYGRHQIRGCIRVTCDVGTCVEDIDLGRGTEDYIDYGPVPVTALWVEQCIPWSQASEFGLADAGALSNINIGGGWMNGAAGGAAEVWTAECYVDIDCRYHPDYVPEVQDNAGVDQSGGTVTDTNQPVMFFGAVAYDGLPALDWSVTVRDAGAVTVFSASGSGTPPTEVLVTTGLADAPYTAAFSVRSTIRGADPFEYAETLSFTIANTVPPPSPPLLTVEEEFGGYRVSWGFPGGQEWDDGYVVAEVWRDDCTGSSRIAVIPDGLNGSYLDLAIPQLDPQPVPGPDCATSSEACDITYRVRYWGYISTYVGLPGTLPASMILGWPGTVASIPSGWSRVTSLDGRYPLGTSGTGAPSGTGGSGSHIHNLAAAHGHTIGAHNHTQSGSTGTSNSNTTTDRYNGADRAQADQPHNHVVATPTTTEAAQFSGLFTPNTDQAGNLPLTRDVIWISSDGLQTDYPVGVLGWSAESVAAWDTDATSSGRFLRGAATAGDGGASVGASTHTHVVDVHPHTGFSHTHSVVHTGLSNPASAEEADSGVSPSYFLPRHTHPMSVSSATTGDLASAGGGSAEAANLDPPNRRLRVLINTGGGIQTRIIGLYLGTVAALNAALTLCDGTNGTPDMRTWFARDVGSDSVNTTGGASTHSHTTTSHTHGIGGHSHGTSVGVSATGSYGRTLFGDPGVSPTTTHTHSSSNTASATPSVTSNGAGGTTTVSLVPVYAEAHFVRLDGTISGGSLPVPELRTSEYASVTVPSFTYTDDLDRISSTTDRIAVVATRSHDYPRLVADSVPLDGGFHTVSATLAGEDMNLTIVAEGLPAINRLEAMLSNDRVYFSPLGGTPGWYAPAGWSVRAPAPTIKVVQVTMVRQPWPDTADPEDYV